MFQNWEFLITEIFLHMGVFLIAGGLLGWLLYRFSGRGVARETFVSVEKELADVRAELSESQDALARSKEQQDKLRAHLAKMAQMNSDRDTSDPDASEAMRVAVKAVGAAAQEKLGAARLWAQERFKL